MTSIHVHEYYTSYSYSVRCIVFHHILAKSQITAQLISESLPVPCALYHAHVYLYFDHKIHILDLYLHCIFDNVSCDDRCQVCFVGGEVIDDNCCQCHTAAIRRQTRIRDTDLLYVSFHNKVRQ